MHDEKDAMQREIKDLETRLTEEQRQHGLAVSNANVSRLARNEAQEALTTAEKTRIDTKNHLDQKTTAL